MAEALLGVVTEAVLSKALSLASEEISSWWGVEKDLQNLAKTVEVINALLCDAAAKQITIKAVELWLRDVSRVASDAEILLDEFGYQVLRRKIENRKRDKVSNFFSSSNPLSFRIEMAHQIKKINLSLDDLYAEANKIGLNPIQLISSSVDTSALPFRMTNSCVDESEIVGRRGDVERIISLLTSWEDEKNLSVTGVVGMAGHGKTTIAKLVCKHKKVVTYFDEIIWVCVSEDFRAERILSQMLEVLTGSNPHLTSLEALVKALQEKLSAKRFLLVLDDVWNEKRTLWESARVCLHGLEALRTSRILVTTRSMEVLSTMQVPYNHELGGLSNEDGWELFQNAAFAVGGAIKTKELVSIGKNIVKRCRGVPLAIKVMGGMMYHKKDEAEWLKIQESDTWGSLDGFNDGVFSVIKLSYDHLPSLPLKQCFAYCALFQKDYVMEREQVIQLWMAQGLIHPPLRECDLKMEDVGNSYFNILLQRSLLHDAQVDDLGIVTSCKMHDLVHDCAREISKGHCLTVEGRLLSDNIRSVHLTILKANGLERPLNCSSENFQKLRTLFLLGHGLMLADILGNCKHLNVLTVVDYKVKEFPSLVGELKHLRYLDISRTSVATLPNSITRLYYLQTLKLPEALQELPTNFQNLISLRHFCIENPLRHCFKKKLRFPWIRELASLQTLPYFVVSHERGCQIEELGTLQNLKGRVSIFSLENVDTGKADSTANLSSKQNIESLDLRWELYIQRREHHNNDEEVLEGLRPHSNLRDLRIKNFAGKHFPSWIACKGNEIRNIVRLEFNGLDNTEEIPPLGHLQNLKFLELMHMKSVKRISSEFYGLGNPDAAAAASCIKSSFNSMSGLPFPSLKRLKIYGMPSLEEWCDPPALAQAVFPHLEELCVVECPKLSRIPSLTSVACLGNFFIRSCPNLKSIPALNSPHLLRTLKIYECPALAEELKLESCTSLQYFGITVYQKTSLEILPKISYLTNLRGLVLGFSDSDDSTSFGNIPCWSNTPLVNLVNLTLQGNPKLKSLPHQIQHLPALRELWISRFKGLEALPEWLGNITTLQGLHLNSCHNLSSFPSKEAMGRLANLRKLDFGHCPILEERCKKGSGQEWHKIAHIPQIYINSKPFV